MFSFGSLGDQFVMLDFGIRFVFIHVLRCAV